MSKKDILNAGIEHMDAIRERFSITSIDIPEHKNETYYFHRVMENSARSRVVIMQERLEQKVQTILELMCDESGVRIFNDRDADVNRISEARQKLGKWNPIVIDRIFDHINENMIDISEKEITKNSSATSDSETDSASLND